MSEARGPAGSAEYGVGDISFRAAGGIEGIRKLVDVFYDFMDSLDEAQTVRALHPGDLSLARDKLACFLSGWLNGPKLYAAKYGPIHIPRAHAHLSIGVKERDAWLLCMARALEEQPYPEEFKSYLLRELAVPAEFCRNR